ncbi:Clavaminate synthase-like protein [Armillaria solidipes]|uniref:Clavaminate synthase-like protein n=1 Tax=Armillaria solidipes TaxID=1076256 RepID=A0A2H3B8S2_9AGAR|nr:Clavaminate synthase-like protein [Armillaria solidipes]
MDHHSHFESGLGSLLTNQRTESSFEEIPIIDITNATSTDPVARRVLANEIRDACINVGFFYINNHGIAEDTITAAIDAGKKFFALPTSSKMDLDIHRSSNYKGYTALLGENTDPKGHGDLHEGFDLGWEEQDLEEMKNETAMSGRNVWPEMAPGFKEPVLKYYHEAVRLGQKLFPLFALALDLPEDFFKDKTTKPAAIMRLLHYPSQKQSSVDEQEKVLGIGAHTDYECFTILWQDRVPALQVKNATGKWIDAVPIPGTLVLNLGDQFARWTNDVFKSTLHRAINRSGEERYSIPLFFGTDYDVLLEPIPSCVSPEYPSKYEVVTAGEYVKTRLDATYAHSAVKSM